MDASQLHAPVMREECLELLRPALERANSTYVDCTLGMAGHACAVLEAFPNTHLVGIDRDAAALGLARERLIQEGFDGRFTLVHTTYDGIVDALAEAGREKADGILMDLGLSSFQIDTRERGFAYSVDAPLDMRMNPDGDSLTAADILNTWSEQDIANILYRYGEEKFSRRIARTIVQERASELFERSPQLVSAIERSLPAKSLHSGGHPAKRTFQALRIAVNEELDILRDALDSALGALALGGRLVIESYHSLEDRMVKEAFVAASTSKTPAGLPVDLAEFAPNFSLVKRGAMKAPAREQETNPRSASVRLRAIERTTPPEIS
ncbi:16S rRNA (cytosine(1402)-N(4))-methyltransferase RsmH [Dermabacter vaginalis]|uniref:Ribosomal RNA small subunit methyltransferase H n=1 Tax=Dermabacter vaginalis TaxID=1630135 RepID=A0ABX6A2P4_9MICO|nr:16S rRNA (cytosine(1402)-N(4))-methyltransferase RsmH [Dermabacter vaginalis]QEU11443.1 16S rRNA (cytosine(1402)-N(4))-methyltransferase RsmH [Dermabacter vaginalis]